MNIMFSSMPSFVRPLKNAEPPEWYQPGGFCPVRLNQAFADRYRVLRKLGWGTCSTVWLAKDENRYVALKIGVSTGCRLEQEAEVLRKLGRSCGSGETNINTQRLLDAFQHNSPNGTHQVLVLEPLGHSLERRIQLQSHGTKLLGSAYVKDLAKQLLLGLSRFHSNNLVHRDIQPGNILFALSDTLESLSEAEMHQDEASSDDVLKIERLGSEPLDETTPSYVVNPWPLGDDSQFQTQDLRAVITDFGAASSFEDLNDGYHAYPVAVRPPELVLNMSMTAPQAEIWSLGCLIYQAATSRKLFSVGGMGSMREEQDDEYLQSITEVLGTLPKSFLQNWERRADFVHEDGTLLEKVVEEGISEPLDDLVRMYKPRDMSEDEVMKFIDFLRSMLQVEPTARSLTGELLEHPWLQPDD